MLVVSSVRAEDIVFKDPKGDDDGPGGYTYPPDQVYKKGSFDLTELAALRGVGRLGA